MRFASSRNISPTVLPFGGAVVWRLASQSGFTVIQLREMQVSIASETLSWQADASAKNNLAA